ncbi:hypothetical protein NXS08_05250 [Gleimia sp. 6138-11-ORH1]|uniref:hypothetical protein n=1 Tax=Gleimia sp. 6138-11-ORH1 TaxID=2973937 RepID=UPI00216A067A|nr:hypothetical protein [Gleimia sp. 6138-11-ORH1]MCS4484880.1 hypothetical protein [Gleimia sp. 6138-11-ORH1]
MTGILLVFLFVMGISLLLAIGALLVILLSRRSLRDWQTHYTAENRQWKEEDEAGIVYEPVAPTQGDFYKVVDENATLGSGYLTAEELAVPEDMKPRNGR